MIGKYLFIFLIIIIANFLIDTSINYAKSKKEPDIEMVIQAGLWVLKLSSS